MSEQTRPGCRGSIVSIVIGAIAAAVFWWLAVAHPWYVRIGPHHQAPTPTTSPYACQVMDCTPTQAPVWKRAPNAAP